DCSVREIILPIQIAQSGKERDRAVPDIVMGLGACVTFLQRKGGAVCAPGLGTDSSRRSTAPRPASGGSIYSPITSQNFSSKFGSLEILKVSSRCGLMSLWLQMRCTVLLLTLASRAMERTLHRVRPCGGRVARSTIKEILSAGSRALRPLPGASVSPAIP